MEKPRHLGEMSILLQKLRIFGIFLHLLLLTLAVKCLSFSNKSDYRHLKQYACAEKLEGNMKKWKQLG